MNLTDTSTTQQASNILEDAWVEPLAITFLQFVGLLFYSYTIQKIQDLLITDVINAGEYAAQM